MEKMQMDAGWRVLFAVATTWQLLVLTLPRAILAAISTPSDQATSLATDSAS